MKIAFDVDVLAKQMPIREYVHKVADWGYKYIKAGSILPEKERILYENRL